MTEHLYKGPGTYYATLYVRASNTGTESWNISAGVTDKTQMLNNFVVAATREVRVLEICPNIDFELNGTPMTVVSNYSDDTTTSYTPAVSAPYGTYGIISGYAPHVDVTFDGYVSARSLPISAIRWDFGDTYVNSITADENTLYGYPTAGWPTWTNLPYHVTGHHVYVMPGLYNVTLLPIVSSPQIGYVSNCTGFEKPLHVYVKEIEPVASLNTSAFNATLSGSTPFTVYVGSSGTVAGSFPICRMSYDFGDGTPLVTLSRWVSSEYSQYYQEAYFADASDPRNVVVPHTYTRTLFTQPETYTITLSVYACNTNAVGITSMVVGPIDLQTLSYYEGDIHLIENRMYHKDNDLLLVFEGQQRLGNYTVLLSSTGV
jgi:hypothetical protein